MDEGDLIAGRYRLLRPIGSGATGVVWAARHELLDREFALKISAERRGAPERQSREARARFLREVRIVGRLRHPNIVDIADAGELGQGQGQGLYLAMELLQGESLAQRIARGPLAAGDALSVLAEVCRALATAHAAGVIHRDIKPENIFLARGAAGGVIPKLLDFGVSSARGIATLQGDRVLGTPAYMSPEQALGEGVLDRRTDVWAIGVVLYEMLTGRHPFAAASYPALLPLIIEAPYTPLPPSVPSEARTVVAGCLAKDRADRYASADALAEAIDRALTALTRAGASVTSTGFFIEAGVGVPTSSREPADLPSVRATPRSLALLVLAVPVLIGLAATVSTLQRRRGPASAAAGSATPPPGSSSASSPSADVPSAALPASDAGVPATTTSARPPVAPRGRGRSVTRINNAGF